MRQTHPALWMMLRVLALIFIIPLAALVGVFLGLFRGVRRIEQSTRYYQCRQLFRAAKSSKLNA